MVRYLDVMELDVIFHLLVFFEEDLIYSTNLFLFELIKFILKRFYLTCELWKILLELVLEFLNLIFKGLSEFLSLA